MPFRSFLGIALLLVTFPAIAEEPLDDATFFRAQVRPLLSEKCFKCHGPGTQEADLRLDEHASLLESGSIIEGNPDESELLRRVISDDEFERMPPADVSDPLTKTQIAVLREWIRRGTPYAEHWAYSRDSTVAPPASPADTWAQNGIDPFIIDRLAEADLAPSPPADRTTLIRRASLDLIGLLPSPDEVEAFVADTQPDAYERLIDRLIASPHFGERQARHWLDLARYADSNGYTVDGARTIWPYRDWVIDSLNDNKRFDEFTIEQLAGDLLPNPSREQLVATGLQRNTPFNEEGGTDPEQFRVERTIDRTNTIGSVWLGLTVACSQCHDHKYDAISQREYYELYAFFNSVDEAKLPLPTTAQQRQIDELQIELQKAKAESGSNEADMTRLRTLAKGSASLTWKSLQPTSLKSSNGSELTLLDDGSVLASGETPATDAYVISTVLPPGRVSAIQLEALTHPSLPKNGPGRASNGNFVLSRIEMSVPGKSMKLSHAVADHSQENYDVSFALTGNRSKGWAISTKKGNQNVDRTAVFALAEPIDLAEATPAQVTLTFSTQPPRYTLGRFRLSVTDADPQIVALPIALQKQLSTGEPIRDEDLQKVAQQVRTTRIAEIEAQLKHLQSEITSTLIFRPLDKPRETHIHKRGDFLNLGDKVAANTFASLPPLSSEGSEASRLDLARWLVRDDHPLTPRVVVNRIWQQYFGLGLVETENDFGVQGSLPTHPELLDWLAGEFVSSGWDLKHIHRLIVTSATYQQSSNWREDSFAKDPRNKLLARQNRLRVEAEILRDAALSASGKLSDDIGGPGVFPPQPDEVFSFTQSQRQWAADTNGDRYRRGMYTYLWRQSQHPLMTTFDGPDAQTSCTRRNRSNTPLQALHLANDEVFVELAAGLAERVLAAELQSDADRLDYAFELCLARKPASEERELMVTLLRDQQAKHPDTAWTLLARTLLNLDEFVTRE